MNISIKHLSIKLIVFFTGLCINMFPIKAQHQFAELGTTWKYIEGYCEVNPGLLGHHTIEVVGDTIIQGKLCKRLIRSTDFYCSENTPKNDSFVYQEGDKVFYWFIDKFILLYDFSAEVGDTVFHYHEPLLVGGEFEVHYAVVAEVNMVEIGGYSLREAIYDTLCCIDEIEECLCPRFNSRIIENIGDIHGFPLISHQILPGFGGHSYLNCYENNNLQFGSINCLTSVEPKSLNAIKIYPTLVNNLLFFDLPKHLETQVWDVVIFSNSGQKVKQFQLSPIKEQSHSMRDVPIGVYYVHLPKLNETIRFVKH